MRNGKQHVFLIGVTRPIKISLGYHYLLFVLFLSRIILPEEGCFDKYVVFDMGSCRTGKCRYKDTRVGEASCLGCFQTI